MLSQRFSFRGIVFEEDAPEKDVNEAAVDNDEVGCTEAAAWKVDFSNVPDKDLGLHVHVKANILELWICCNDTLLVTLL